MRLHYRIAELAWSLPWAKVALARSYLRLPVSLLDMILVVIYMHLFVFPLLKSQNGMNCTSNENRKNVEFLDVHRGRWLVWSCESPTCE